MTLKQRKGYWADQIVTANAYNDRVRFLVLHYTGGDTARALEVLTGPSVSTHYLIAPTPPLRVGRPVVRQLLSEDKRAWHAGASSWVGRHHINDTSIGIEIVNAGPIETVYGPAWQSFSRDQIAAMIALARDIIARHDIEPQNVIGHADVAPGRKIDPGPAFPWEALYRSGIGAWPDAARVAAYRRQSKGAIPDIAQIQAALVRYGYDLPVNGELDQRTHAVLVSFQMHFCPERHDGVPDVETVARLWALNDKYR